MRISVEISLYPLDQAYVEIILAYIDRLEQNSALIVKRNSLSTQVFGEYRDVMDTLDREMESVFAQVPHSVFVMKFIGTDRKDVVDKV